MKFKSLFLTLIIMFLARHFIAQTDSSIVNKKRVLIVGTSIAVSCAASYYYLQNTWWDEERNSFHFDHGADLTYALNVDKLGHFMGGMQAADIFSSSMEWTGINKKKAIWYGGAFGAGLQLAIEIKDAYAPHWGFSKWDLALGSAGALWFVAQQYNNYLKAINFKFSYYKHSDVYLELERQRDSKINSVYWHDDYPNQTYWATFDIKKITGIYFWPDWLNMAVGFGLDNTQYLNKNKTKKGGNNEWYIALDYDLSKIYTKWDSPTAKNIKHWLNYIHFPAPTIRISPKLEFYPVFL